MQCWTTSSAWKKAKGFQSRKTDDDAFGAGLLINFLFAGFKLKAPSSLSGSDKNISIPKTNQFTNFFLFQCREQLNKCSTLEAFFWMSVFSSSFEINDMHVQTIFIGDLEKPIALVNCYFGLYIKTNCLFPVDDLSWGRHVEDN